jgi:hypothetical protein
MLLHPDCSLKLPIVSCDVKNQVQNEDGMCSDQTTGDFVGLWNYSLFEEVTGRKRISPSEEYWKYVEHDVLPFE